MRGARKQAPVDALLVTRVEDVRYLSGFTGEDSFLLVGPSCNVLLTDGRYLEQARRDCEGIEVHGREDSLAKAAAMFAKKHRIRRLGVQAEDITVLLQEQLRALLKGGRTVPVRNVLSRLREVKDDREIKAIRRAIRVAERAFRRLTSRGRRALVGRSERDVAAELDYLMRIEGASGPAFETIVAAGANASRPHHRPGSRRIGHNQAVLIDWGAKVGGYCGDLTRVVFTGTIPREIAKLHDVVNRAQTAGIGAIRPGAMCKSADAAAREVVCGAGYAEKFLHGLGHGIGLAVHEGPSLAAGCQKRLRVGMVLTVEPAIYLRGLCGIRIEDDILVTRSGREKLSTLPRSLRAMTLS
jgi:Xaa-Pro aminopeptidase